MRKPLMIFISSQDALTAIEWLLRADRAVGPENVVERLLVIEHRRRDPAVQRAAQCAPPQMRMNLDNG